MQSLCYLHRQFESVFERGESGLVRRPMLAQVDDMTHVQSDDPVVVEMLVHLGLASDFANRVFSHFSRSGYDCQMS